MEQVTVYKTYYSNGFSLEEIKAKCQPQKMTMQEWERLIETEEDDDVNWLAFDENGKEIIYE